MAATAVQVTTPKASRTTPEAFASTLGRGLADQHAVLPLRPESLRRLDKIDAIVIDPRILCTDTLRVARVAAAADDDTELTAAWNRAQLMLEKNSLRPGWRAVRGISGGRPNTKVEALFLPAHEPLASAVVAEAHRTGAELISVDVDSLDELRPAFDEIRPVKSGTDSSIDEALAAAVADLEQAGRTVAVLSSSGAQSISSASLMLGMKPKQGAPPFNADLLLPDLAAAWRVLHALPAAKTAIQRGVGIAAGATAMGSLFMIPGVRGNLGSESVNARRGGRSHVGISARPRHPQRGYPTPGGRARMACDVGRTGPQAAARTRCRASPKRGTRPNRTNHPCNRFGSSPGPFAPNCPTR